MSTSAVSSEIIIFQQVSKFIFAYGGIFLIVLGTIGNMLNIFVFLYQKTLRRMPNSIFLFTLFIASLIHLWTVRFSHAMLSLTSVDLLDTNLFQNQIKLKAFILERDFSKSVFYPGFFFWDGEKIFRAARNPILGRENVYYQAQKLQFPGGRSQSSG
jgi:hypothetical protein